MECELKNITYYHFERRLCNVENKIYKVVQGGEGEKFHLTIL